ncbi:MAG: hypothetical protein J5554_03040 [Paludibacteraceae bacterium]|nr:hypothetical protein [Paludibacteraceae bacterium]
MSKKEDTGLITFFILFYISIFFYLGFSHAKKFYTTIDLEKNGIVTSCKVVRQEWDSWNKELSYEVLLNGEKTKLYQSSLLFSGYKENEEVIVLWKEGCDFVIPKDSTFSHPNIIFDGGFVLILWVFPLLVGIYLFIKKD